MPGHGAGSELARAVRPSDDAPSPSGPAHDQPGADHLPPGTYVLHGPRSAHPKFTQHPVVLPCPVRLRPRSLHRLQPHRNCCHEEHRPRRVQTHNKCTTAHDTSLDTTGRANVVARRRTDGTVTQSLAKTRMHCAGSRAGHLTRWRRARRSVRPQPATDSPADNARDAAAPSARGRTAQEAAFQHTPRRPRRHLSRPRHKGWPQGMHDARHCGTPQPPHAQPALFLHAPCEPYARAGTHARLVRLPP